jgi:CHAT domain-containing protein
MGGGRKMGGRPGQPEDTYNEHAWMRLDIRKAAPDPELPNGCRDIEFTSMARRARADRLVQRTETALVNDLMARAVTDPNPDPQVCNTLYELLVPDELKYDLFNADNLHLLLEEDTACYPWEALAPRYTAGDKPLASRTGVLRQFAERETRLARFGVRRASGRHVLVIGNPPAGENGPELPGAAAEAQQVAEVLAADRGGATGHQVHALIWSEDGPEATNLPQVNDAQSWVHIVNALYRHEYRIVHIAAHGVYNSEDPTRSGVVIGPGDHFLTALTVNQMPVVPELVFLNCCHSGRMGDPTGVSDADRQVNLLAAGVARSLMGIGVRAVIASGWAVDDTAAALFATTFYECAVVRGERFGDAVRKAREVVQEASDSLTWAAYQCYGDPAFRLQASSDW